MIFHIFNICYFWNTLYNNLNVETIKPNRDLENKPKIIYLLIAPVQIRKAFLLTGTFENATFDHSIRFLDSVRFTAFYAVLKTSLPARAVKISPRINLANY